MFADMARFVAVSPLMIAPAAVAEAESPVLVLVFVLAIALMPSLLLVARREKGSAAADSPAAAPFFDFFDRANDPFSRVCTVWSASPSNQKLKTFRANITYLSAVLRHGDGWECRVLVDFARCGLSKGGVWILEKGARMLRRENP